MIINCINNDESKEQVNTYAIEHCGLARYDAASLSASGSFGKKKVAFGVKVTVIFRDPELSHLKAMLSRH